MITGTRHRNTLGVREQKVPIGPPHLEGTLAVVCPDPVDLHSSPSLLRFAMRRSTRRTGAPSITAGLEVPFKDEHTITIYMDVPRRMVALPRDEDAAASAQLRHVVLLSCAATLCNCARGLSMRDTLTHVPYRNPTERSGPARQDRPQHAPLANSTAGTVRNISPMSKLTDQLSTAVGTCRWSGGHMSRSRVWVVAATAGVVTLAVVSLAWVQTQRSGGDATRLNGSLRAEPSSDAVSGTAETRTPGVIVGTCPAGRGSATHRPAPSSP